MNGLQDFQGTWQAVFLVEEDRKRGAGEVRDTRVTISGDRYTLHRGGYAYHGVIRGIDPTRNHGPIDFVAGCPDSSGKRWLGIYVLEEGELTVCVAAPGQERPTSFAPKPGRGHWLYLLKRCGASEELRPARCEPVGAGASGAA
jgi:uncharacterized protein (TIGR03067 family)